MASSTDESARMMSSAASMSPLVRHRAWCTAAGSICCGSMPVSSSTFITIVSSSSPDPPASSAEAKTRQRREERDRGSGGTLLADGTVGCELGTANEVGARGSLAPSQAGTARLLVGRCAAAGLDERISDERSPR
eukprot:CAMPEP_0114317868 /NCGR_PEP_ID=MMETSP0059-20121206/24186_1 /TAXON_ID=36894 /ORGANISM="Pyramimonas parkeae, Strain CCMP726" /LENGTH=134 /DNA_ID=CAMNT_0001444335 /DNA_START=72 /DNA_END=477 /DNA_ORIENTATION=+